MSENDIAGCVECGEPLDHKHASAHCSKCFPPPPQIVDLEAALKNSLKAVHDGIRRSGSPIADAMSPFPQEPAFGSPEAVEQVTETITRGPSRQQLDDWRAGAHPDSRMQQLYLAAVRFQEQRDALADALEAAIRTHYGRTARELAERGHTETTTGGPGNWTWRALEALRKAGR